MAMTDPARAARLTAIAERLDSLAAKPTQTYRELDMAADLRFLIAHVETLTQQVAELQAASPSGVDSPSALPQTGDWPRVAPNGADSGRLSELLEMARTGRAQERDRAERAEQENARLTDENMRLAIVLDELTARAEHAEQQRDTAHAALREIRQYADENYNDLSGGAIMSLCDAALAPAQETERGR